tara:strand:+ start:187 stop:1569 length:1383 start_codon:yes stop_codon:yes gene_type:complete
MTRRGSIQERHVVVERIERDTRHGPQSMNARIPVWNADGDVLCHQIRLPLDHLFLRLRNARTTDTQIAFTSSNHDFKHPLTEELIATPEQGIFDDARQFEQATQNMQAVLLCIEAHRRRENGNTLFETLKNEGWRPKEVPIITREGVLINGNSRVAAIEAMLNAGEEIDGIDSAMPQIEVKVVPNDGAGESDIQALENYLQKPDGARLNYNWYQDTTIIRRRLVNEAESRVHNDYKDLTRFETIPKMRKTLAARTLIDELFVSIGLENQAILHNPNEHMAYAMQDQIAKDYVANDAEYSSKARALFAAFNQLTLDRRAIGEMRYHVTRIKKVEDIDAFHEVISEHMPDIVTSETIIDDFDDSEYNQWALNPEIFNDSTAEVRDEMAGSIYELAEELKDRNKGEDSENAIIKRLKEATSKVRKSMELRENFAGDYPREEELESELNSLSRALREYNQFRAD